MPVDSGSDAIKPTAVSITCTILACIFFLPGIIFDRGPMPDLLIRFPPPILGCCHIPVPAIFLRKMRPAWKHQDESWMTDAWTLDTRTLDQRERWHAHVRDGATRLRLAAGRSRSAVLRSSSAP